MKKWLRAFAIIIAVFLMLYAFAYFFVIPKAAEAALPFKWKNVPAGLKRNAYEIYLGKPSTDKNKNVWIVRNGNYTFSLTAAYNTDSIVENIQIDYTFSNYLFYKKGVIRMEDK